MGAISGIYNYGIDRPVDGPTLEAMSAVQKHRGPAYAGVHVNGRLGLANRRLGIIDAVGGRQPMSNDSGTVWLTFSGEIFNHREIRSDLEARGRRFRTQSDAEVVLGAYETFGKSFVERLNGQFALAIWDQARSELFLARDPLGIAPLHYTEEDGQFVFASEAKGVLKHPAGRPEADPYAVVEALLCGTLFGGRTMFARVKSLGPGSTLTVTGNGCRESVYWSMPGGGTAQARGEQEPSAEHVLSLLEDAVRSSLVGDADWGIMLSGGVDSTTLTALASRVARRQVRTFTIDFEDRWRGEDVDAHYAALVARRFETDHHLFMSSPDDYFAVLEKLAWHLEKPYNKAAATVHLLYAKLSPHATFALSGEGMDELLAGYVGARGLGIDGDGDGGGPREFPWAPHPEVVNRLFTQEARHELRPLEVLAERLSEALGRCPTSDGLNRALDLYSRYFLLELVELHERASHAVSVETRFPFLDRRLVELIAPLPSDLKYRDGQTKYLLKQAAGALIPPEVLARRKAHLPIPRDPRSMATQVELARELLLGPGARTARYFDPVKVGAFLQRRDDFEGTDALTVWQVSLNLITLELLYRQYGMT